MHLALSHLSLACATRCLATTRWYDVDTLTTHASCTHPFFVAQIEGLEDVEVDIWLDPVTLKAFASTHYTERHVRRHPILQDGLIPAQPGATDVDAALREWFGDEQLLSSQDEFIADLQCKAQLPSLDGTTHILGPVACGDGTLDIYTAPLASAPEGFKVVWCCTCPRL